MNDEKSNDSIITRFPTVLNLPAVTGVTSSSTSGTGGKLQHTSSRVVTSTQYEYHTGQTPLTCLYHTDQILLTCLLSVV